MNKHIEKLPKQYRESIRDFYKDDDGWWICLSEQGLYYLDGYVSQYTIHEDTQAEALAQFRQCVRRKAEERLYLAYGSNLNLRQMKIRCPRAKLIGYAHVENYHLMFRGSGSGSYLSIEPKAGKSVPCGVFKITEADERSLDRYEGFPRFYRKKKITTYLYALDGKSRLVSATVYYLPKNCPAGLPSASYIRTCKEGYVNCGFDEETLKEALADTWEEI